MNLLDFESDGHWILLPNGEIKEVGLTEWATWLKDDRQRIIGRDYLRPNTDKEVMVSTVFLGLDHRFGGDGPPILFETMVFGGMFNQHMERYCTLTEAIEGHARTLRMVKQGAPRWLLEKSKDFWRWELRWRIMATRRWLKRRFRIGVNIDSERKD